MATERSQQKRAGRWDDRMLDVYEGRFQDLVRVASRYLDCDGQREDAVQTAFVQCLQSGSEPELGREYAYLRMCVLNVARTMLRRRYAEERLPDSPEIDWDPAGAWTDQSVAEEQVRTAMGSLSERQAEVVVLRYFLEYSEAETAAHLGVSPGSIKTHASRARRSMRTQVAFLEAAA